MKNRKIFSNTHKHILPHCIQRIAANLSLCAPKPLSYPTTISYHALCSPSILKLSSFVKSPHSGSSLVDLANRSFESGTGRVLARFWSLLGQLCLDRVWVRFGWNSDLGHFRVLCSGQYGVGSTRVWIGSVLCCLL